MIKTLKYIIKFAIFVSILALGVYTARYLISTRPEPAKSVPEVKPLLVDIITAERTNKRVIVEGQGTVRPSKTVSLQPEVQGRIIEQSPQLIPGGRFKKGEVIVQIDPRDYEHAVDQQQAKVESALFALRQEKGQQVIAQKEWQLLGDEVETTDVGRELALRKPHLQYAQATLAAASSALEKARLDLQRTTIRAPFNCMVIEESVDIGQFVSPQTRIARLIGADEFWVEVSVRMDRLPWIRLPEINAPECSKARVIHEVGMGTTIKRDGRVVRLLGDLGVGGKLARLLISIPKPLDAIPENPGLPLLVEAYVDVEIEGRFMDGVIVLPREALREGDKVWIMDENDRLDIRDIQVVWRMEQAVCVKEGINDGERIITSSISTPLKGMMLRLSTSEDEPEPGYGDLEQSQPLVPAEEGP